MFQIHCPLLTSRSNSLTLQIETKDAQPQLWGVQQESTIEQHPTLYFFESVVPWPQANRRVGANYKAEGGKRELMGRLLKWQCFPCAYA